uniref:Uncharacterized protein n=1 Tax=Caenorhabditis japonica TaxID=281687 RepID=A0A8R1IFH9_CAEJA
MSSRPKRLRLSCRKVCELWFPDDETNPDECDRIGDNPMVNEETEGFWEEHVENTERHTMMGWRKNFKKFLVCQNLINKLQNLVTERNYGRLRLCVWILKTSNAQNRRLICCLAFLEAKRSPHTKFLIAVMTSKNASSAAKKGTNSKEALQGGGDGANPAFNSSNTLFLFYMFNFLSFC